jgi:hypothetical protein
MLGAAAPVVNGFAQELACRKKLFSHPAAHAGGLHKEAFHSGPHFKSLIPLPGSPK